MSRNDWGSRVKGQFNLKDKAVIVTGAATGIGLALSQELAWNGARVALVDIRPVGLRQALALLGGPDYSRSSHVLDISDAGAVQDFAEHYLRENGAPDVLVNNAGIASGCRFNEMSAEVFNRVMSVNFNGAVNMCRSFLPALEQQAGAQLVNVASIGAFSSAPGYSAYCASKYALRGLTEALQQEYMNSNLHVMLVNPGGIRTGLEINSVEILDRADRQKVTKKETDGMNSAEYAAKQICRAITQRKKRIFVGTDAKALYAAGRIAPNLLSRLVTKKINPA